MTTEELQKIATHALRELKAIDLTELDVRELTTITDTMIICSGRSTRHVVAMAQSVVTAAKQAGAKYVKMEGENEGEWVIVDLGDVVVHVMIPASRSFYNLEDLWTHVAVHREAKK